MKCGEFRHFAGLTEPSRRTKYRVYFEKIDIGVVDSYNYPKAWCLACLL